ncbi:MAG: type I restriction enzyme HsdR N-terminal domain-containing protein [Chitinophagaceae bacterium]
MLQTKIIDNKTFVFDTIRKKWLLLTPEERIRQQVVKYLVDEKKIPKSLIALEKTITINNLTKRFDILVYKESKPWLLIECKEPNVTLNDATLQQILNYNHVLQVKYFAITNGQDLLVWSVETNHCILMDDIPNWK